MAGEYSMDFRNANNQPAQSGRTVAPGQPPVPAPGTPQQPHHDHKQPSGFFGRIPGWLRVTNIVLLFGITILIIAVIFVLRGTNPNQSQYVIKDKYQAVFLENGQVYFGKITALNNQFINLQNVFYLNSQSQNGSTTQEAQENSNNFTLVKLGCELHGPYDQMIINSNQVTFWENITSEGQVSKTIAEWVKQNPNGQKCEQSTGSTDQSTSGGSSTSTSNTNTGTSNSGTNKTNQ